MPLKMPALNMSVLAIGGIISSPGRAEDDDAAGRVRALQPLRHRDRGGHADRALRAVLVAVKDALRAAQRVVFENDAQIRRAAIAFVARHERGLQIGHTHGHFEAVLL